MYFIKQWLEEAALKVGGKTAYVWEDDEITYDELHTQVKEIAKMYIDRGIAYSPIAVCMEQGIDLWMNILAVLYSNNYFTVIDSHFPQERVDKIFETFKPVAAVLSEERQLQIPSYTACIKNSTFVENPLEHYGTDGQDKDIFAIIYTSGSTGIPKGAILSNDTFSKIIIPFGSAHATDDNTVFACTFSPNSVVFFYMVFSALQTCTTCVLPNLSKIYKPDALIGLYKKNSVTVWLTPPSVLKIFSSLHKVDSIKDTSLTKILFAGESIPIPVLNEWIVQNKTIVYGNIYGCTEAGIISYCYYKEKEVVENILSIGKPPDNVRIRYEKIEPNSDDLYEIYVSGETLFSGYLNDNEKSNKCLMRLNDEETYYRTGDVAKIGKDGRMYFAGRADLQVNKNGYRIEIEDIENTTIEIPDICDACCVITDNQKVVMFYKGDMNEIDLHHELREKLPDYMLPNAIIKIDEIPLNTNGKKDRKKLKQEGEIWNTEK